MDNLYENIKKGHDQQNLPEPPGNAWDDFLKYAERRDNPRRFPWVPVLISGLLLLLLTSNILWYLKSDTKSATPEASLLSQTDTIYITKYLNTSSDQALKEDLVTLSQWDYDQLVKKTNELTNTKYALLTLEQNFNKLRKEWVFQQSQISSFSFLNKPETKNNQPGLNYSASTIDSSTQNVIPTFNSSLGILNPIPGIYPGFLTPGLKSHRFSRVFHAPKDKRSFIDIIRPKSLSLGLHSGFAGLLNHALGSSGGNAFGISATSLFSRRIRASLGVDYLRAKGNTVDVKKLSKVPYMPPPPEGVLREVYFNNNLLSYSLSLDYLLKSYGRFRPFAGLVYSFNHSKYDELDYEFYTPSGEVYIRLEGSIMHYDNRDIGLRIGTDINIANNVDAYFIASYNANILGESGSYYYIRPGIYYHF